MDINIETIQYISIWHYAKLLYYFYYRKKDAMTNMLAGKKVMARNEKIVSEIKEDISGKARLYAE